MPGFNYAPLAHLAESLTVEFLGKAFKKQSEIVAAVTSGFAANIARVDALCRFPPLLLETATKWQAVNDMALMSLTKTLHPTEDQQPPQEQLDAERAKLWESIHRGGEYSLMIRHKGKPSPSPVTSPLLINSEQLDYLIDSARLPFVTIGGHAVLSSILLGAYTVFDSLSSDLWLAAVNARPRTLARDALEKGDTAEDGADGPKPEPSVPFSMLLDNDFNLSAQMGTVLKKRKRVSFESLEGIKKAYLAAFRTPGDKTKRPSNGMTQLFGKHHADIRVLEAMRNLISHRGGRVDQKFRDEVRPYSEELYAVSVGAELPLDGARVAKYAEAAIRFSADLLTLVDNWLTKHPDK
jgi:hypothetical protein